MTPPSSLSLLPPPHQRFLLPHVPTHHGVDAPCFLLQHVAARTLHAATSEDMASVWGTGNLGTASEFQVQDSSGILMYQERVELYHND